MHLSPRIACLLLVVVFLGLARPCHANKPAYSLFDAHFVSHYVEGAASFLEATQLNADPITDFIVIGGFQSKPSVMSVLLGTSNGAFETFDVQALGFNPSDLKLIDLDGDTDLDLAMTEDRTDRTVLHLFEQTQPGIFRETGELESVFRGQRITVGDLNGDGRDDMVVRPYWTSTMGVHLSQPNGGFAPVQGVPIDPYYPNQLMIEDMNDDGKADLVLAMQGAMQLWPGDGKGSFANPILLPVVSANDFAIADLNGDSRMDLAVLAPRSFQVWIANGNLKFTRAAEYETAAYTGDSVRLTTGYLNDDAHVDVLIGNRQTTFNWAFLSHGDGTFAERCGFVAGPGPTAVADVTGDGLADVVAANTQLNVIPGKGDGTFRNRRIYRVGIPGDRNFGHATGDMNGDGHLDVVTVNSVGGTLSILLGDGAGNLLLADEVSVGSYPYSVALADMNADKFLDLVAATGPYQDPEGAIKVLLGDGHGAFSAPLVQTVPPYPSRLQVADINQDGRPDVVTAIRIDSSDYAYSGGMCVLLGDGNGRFSSRNDYVNLGAAQDIALNDFNNDNKLDVVFVASNTSGPFVFFGDGSGNFTAATRQWLVNGAWSLDTGDFDHDGNTDLAIGAGVYSYNPANSGVHILRGDGNGAFVDQQILNISKPQSLVVADLDGDGNPDVAAGSYSGRAITVAFGRADGTFEEYMGYGDTASPRQISVVDLNKDGAPDLVSSNLFEASLSLLLGQHDRSTPVTLSDLSSGWQEADVVIEWNMSFTDPGEVRSIRVARAPQQEGPYNWISDPLPLRSRMRFVDSSVLDAAAWYRIELTMASGSVTFAGPIQAQLATTNRSDYLDVSQTEGVLNLRYSLSTNEPVTLDVFDVRGARIRSLANGIQRSGTHVVDWEWRTGPASVAPGVYFLLFKSSDTKLSRKVVLIR